MDMYDPMGRIALIVDEWGTWYQVEPGTHPRFLYQQNTMRDAIVAAISLDVFNRHCHRVRMANIAQTVNVLQAMILTQKEQMLLTPSYHVFEMYKVHQDAMMVPVDVQSETYTHAGFSVPAVSASASVNAAGHLHLSLSNANPATDIPVRVFVRGMQVSKAQGRVLQGDHIAAHNTFAQPNQVAPRPLAQVNVGSDALQVTLPKMSVAVVEIA
jgi:alpha-N-arabinofuranosidase